MASLSTDSSTGSTTTKPHSKPTPAFLRFATSVYSRRAAPREWRWTDDTLHSAKHVFASFSMKFEHPDPPAHVLKLLEHEPTRIRLPDLDEHRRTLPEEAKAIKMSARGFWAMDCARAQPRTDADHRRPRRRSQLRACAGLRAR